MKKENSDTNWNVLYTASRQEKKVAEKLMEKGVEHYLPMVKILSQWTDRKKVVEKPLFSGYVFVKELPVYEDILKTTGVVAYLRYNGRHAVVRQHEIDTIKSVIRYGYDVAALQKDRALDLGQKVVVTDGPLKGNIGELLKKSDGEFFVIHFENFGNSLQVRIPSGLLKPIQ